MTRLASLIAALCVLIPAGAQAQTEQLPPPYPRPGVNKVFENENFVAWNITWLKQAYPIHRHRYDMVGMYYSDGDRIIVSTEGTRRPVHTDAWTPIYQRAGVTHSEEGASDEPLHALFVEIKHRGLIGGVSGVGVTSPVGSPKELLANENATIWEYGPGNAPPTPLHRHPYETMILSFDAQSRPTVRHLAAGTAHQSDALPGGVRTYVIEIK
jgi:hypothetical protein